MSEISLRDVIGWKGIRAAALGRGCWQRFSLEFLEEQNRRARCRSGFCELKMNPLSLGDLSTSGCGMVWECP